MLNDRNRGSEIASSVMELCMDAERLIGEPGDGAIDAEGRPLSLSSALDLLFIEAARGKLDDTADRALRELVSAESPFPRIRSHAESIVNGYAGWSAEIDGARIPAWMTDMLENDDFLWYLRRLTAHLDPEHGSAAELATSELGDCVLGIGQELAAVIGELV